MFVSLEFKARIIGFSEKYRDRFPKTVSLLEKLITTPPREICNKETYPWEIKEGSRTMKAGENSIIIQQKKPELFDSGFN